MKHNYKILRETYPLNLSPQVRRKLQEYYDRGDYETYLHEAFAQVDPEKKHGFFSVAQRIARQKEDITGWTREARQELTQLDNDTATLAATVAARNPEEITGLVEKMREARRNQIAEIPGADGLSYEFRVLTLLLEEYAAGNNYYVNMHGRNPEDGLALL